MGTSQSSTGPGAGVSLIPPWADPPEADDTDAPITTPEEQDPNQPAPPIAPPARFRDSRRAIGNFVRTGNSQDLRRAMGHYVRSGYGGTTTMTRRLARTAATAGRLNGILQTARTPTGELLQDIALASGNDVNVVLDAIVDASGPADGTQDREASRVAIRNALSDLLVRFPDADLLALNSDQRMYVIQRYAALDVYGRFCLDLQKTILDRAPDAVTGVRRLGYIREFIAEQVAAAFRELAARGQSPTTTNILQLTREALRETMSVFEEYTE